ncbi:MAG: DUF1553 domain-containing protein [Planctomycetes bacterium]|nr:DUF1553 domain-containing protein [Planctomycetota bacterium]
MKRSTVLFLTVALGPAATGLAASPEVSTVLPRGAQRGTEVDLVLNGARLADAQEILFYSPGIRATTLESVSPTQAKAHVQIDADARIGEHCLRLRTQSGISELRTIYVGPYPLVAEKEPNNDLEHAQPIDLNVTVLGVVTNEDMDYFVVDLKKGQRLTTEVVGMRLGSTLFDPSVAILDAKGVVLAKSDDTALGVQDPIASLLAPADGKVTIQLRDSSYGGTANSSYLLHVGTFPRPRCVYPCGGKAGEDLAIQYLGDAAGPFEGKLELPDVPAESIDLFAEADGLVAPSPNRFRVSAFPNVLEVEPNDDVASATPSPIDPPLAFNGIIAKTGDVDCFRFKATKGKPLDVRVVARALRSPLDSSITIYDSKGATLAGNDDSGGPDSYVRFTPAADGEFVLGVMDRLRAGGPDFSYRVEVTEPSPSLVLTIPQVAINSQERQVIAVPRGNRFATLVRATRADFAGEVALSSGDLPQGVALQADNVASNLDVVPVVFEAAADAPISGKLCELTAACADPKVSARGHYRQPAELVIGPNNQPLYSTRVDKLAVAVTQEAPFKVHLVPPKVPIVQGGTMQLQVTVERSPDFKAPVSVRLLFRPPGVGAASAVDIPAEQTEVAYPISAAGNAETRKWKICVLATADVNGPLWVASELCDLEVAPPMLAMKIGMTAAEQGKTASIVCTIDQKQKFEGHATAKLLGLPAGATASDKEITSEDTQVVFDVSIGPKTPAGQHKTLFSRVTVTKDGEPIVHEVGRGGVLRVDPPATPPKDAAATSTPQPVSPAASSAKPMSRLEQLRAAQRAEEAAKHPQTKLEVFPSEVHLECARDEQSLVCRIVQPDGITRDVSSEATIATSDPPLVKVEGHVLRPVADGDCKVRVSFEDHSIEVPVRVKNAAQDRPISFKLDVMPVFAKGGCNSGGCHGSARGQDGFHLSLFGYDPDGDYQRLTREMPARRVDLAEPKESLIIEKALGRVPHTGGERFKEESPLCRTLLTWLDAGTPPDPPAVARVDALEVFPKSLLLEGEGSGQQLVVRAHYSDGTDRDVTKLALYLSNNDATAKVSDSGLVSAGSRGEAFVMARFATFTVGAQVLVIPKGLDYRFPPEIQAKNEIDSLVFKKLEKVRVVPSPECNDETFLRRAFIDIVGLLPTREDHDRFVSSGDPKKREALVDELLGRKEFVDLWVMRFAEMLKIRSSNDVSYKSALLYFEWLADKLGHDVPIDRIVQDLLTATGGTYHNPAANYFEEERDSLKLAENTAQAFMGIRIQCAQCHNHPFDRWTMDDYYGFAAFFAQVGRKPGEDPREAIIFDAASGDAHNPVDGKVRMPKFLGGAEPDVAGRDRREVLAKWIASPDDPYFAKNLANVVWAHFFGKGIVDPMDDVRVSNPPANPELLDALGKLFQDDHYDFKKLVRAICTSRTYQTASETNSTNESDDRNFSHAAVRRMRAEVLLDCLSEVTETPDKFKGLPIGSRAVEIADGETSNYFLTTFGRAKRDSVCSCEVKMEPNLSQALHLLNGETVQRKIASSPVIARMLADKKTAGEIVDELYVRCLSRKPLPDEKAALDAKLPQDDKGLRQALDDVFWALLNSQEFLFNH